VVGALTIGVAEELSQLVLPPDYRTVEGFIAILLVLSLRPRGILGARAY
jgi:branched-chain amino acid transport system permease protein/neutral amino acid transport system permease protein